MADSNVLRLLQLVRDRLEASDARLEIGGRSPEDPRLIHVEVSGAGRLVAVFDAPPVDFAEKQALLTELSRAFTFHPDVIADTLGIGRELASRRLDDELAMLADRAGAVRALVIDSQSPVLWGTSEIRRSEEDIDAALRAAKAVATAARRGVDFAELLQCEPDEAAALLNARGVDPSAVAALAREAERVRQHSRRSELAWRHHLLSARAIAEVRGIEPGEGRRMERGGDFGYLARAFANIYWLLLVFERSFSELHVEGAAVHALPVIEKLVLALPPVDPMGPKGKLIRLPRSQ